MRPENTQTRTGTIAALVIGLLAVACATGTLTDDRIHQPAIHTSQVGGALGKIQGIVRAKGNTHSVGDALVIVECSCLPGPREIRTNADGIFYFDHLPPGSYEIRVLVGVSELVRKAKLEAGLKLRSDFVVDLQPEFLRT